MRRGPSTAYLVSQRVRSQHRRKGKRVATLATCSKEVQAGARNFRCASTVRCQTRDVKRTAATSLCPSPQSFTIIARASAGSSSFQDLYSKLAIRVSLGAVSLGRRKGARCPKPAAQGDHSALASIQRTCFSTTYDRPYLVSAILVGTEADEATKEHGRHRPFVTPKTLSSHDNSNGMGA